MNNMPSSSQIPQPPINKQPILIGRDWFIASILALVVASLWIGLSVYTVLRTSTISEPEQKRLTLFSTDLDEAVFEDLGRKKHILDQSIDETKRVILIREGEGVPETTPTPTQ